MDSFDWQPVWLSLQVALIALAFTFVFGVLLARFFLRRRFLGQAFWEAILLLPLVLPPVVTGYALLILLGANGTLGAYLMQQGIGVLFSPAAAVIASIVVALPLMFTSAKAAFADLDSHSLEAARCCGATEAQAFRSIEIPLAWRGLLAGGILAFARAG